MNKISKLIQSTFERDLMAELAIELYNKGYREDIPIDVCVNDCARINLKNYLREYDKQKRIITHYRIYE